MAYTSLCWSPKEKSIFACGNSQGELCIFDLRSENRKNIINKQKDAILSLDFNKYVPEIVTGSSDGTLKVFDIRNSALPAYVLSGHRYGVNRVVCSPFDKYHLSSGSYDMSVKTWSL